MFWSLRWSDVDPKAHVWDVRAARATAVRALAPHDLEHDREIGDRDEAEHAVDRALMAEHGAWMAGWRWAASEPGGGGPVRAYCCADHSLCGSTEAVADVVAEAVADWRARLEVLGDVFEELSAQPLAPEEAAPAAASRLLPLVLEWTNAEDAWYATFQRILTWALEHRGLDPDATARAVDRALSGHFESWVAPSGEVRERAWSELAQAVGEAPEVVDATTRWLDVRDQTAWRRERLYRPTPVKRDGHVAFIERVDGARDDERARRMFRALRMARDSAARGDRLSWGLLARWQGVVLGLGEAVPFRCGEAFAHGGRERYGASADLSSRFERCLVDTEEVGVTPVARAARVYLDVCFVHPFPDGNARAARLALDHVLTRHGLALHAAEPVFVVARRALDTGAHRLQHVVDYLAGARV